MAAKGLELIQNCSRNNYTMHQLKAYNLVWSISGLTAATATLVILVGLLLGRGYRTPLQRLFLYLTLSTLLGLVNNSLNMVLHFDSFSDSVCTAIGYTDVSLFTTSLLLASGIGLYLLFIIYYQAQGKFVPKIGTFKAAVVEILYVVGVVAIPPGAMTKNVGKFGVAGPVCWIQVYRAEDCIRIHREFELKILLVFTAIMSINIAIFVLLKILSCLLAYRHEHVRAHHIHIAKKASLLVTCLGASFIINITSLWAHHATADSKTPYPVLIAVSLVIPTAPVIIPIGFMLYLQSSKKKLKHLKGAMGRFKKRVSLRRSRELISPQDKGNVTPHHPGCQEPPSTTVSRGAVYTDGFTDVTKTQYGSIYKTTCSE